MRQKIGLILVLSFLVLTFISTSALAAPDHANFFNGPFATGQEVTKACLTCHDKQASDFQDSVHWKWSGLATNKVGLESKEEFGKKNAINNFCISIAGNETRCTSCHAGYGWDGKSEFDFTSKENIDCLVCHAGSDSGYKKAPPGAGYPAEGVDLLKAAKSVGIPNRDNCGTCHFYAGGGDAVKQGDLDSTLSAPSRNHDVHMGGGNMLCQDCHTTQSHQVSGGSLHVIPTGENRVSCETCHSKPHQNDILNTHTATVACQTCHIPTFSKELPTKMRWDWSAAGQDIEPLKDAYGKPTYDKIKGSFVWEKNVTPVYAWYNGKVERYILGDQVDSDGINSLSKPVGDINDQQAKIYPFKVHTGTQISDAINKYLITPHLFGGYWKHFDWGKAADVGMASSGLPYSGKYEFVETEMYLSINHEVVPKENALTCSDCHSASGVLDFVALGYQGDPMQTGGRFSSKNEPQAAPQGEDSPTAVAVEVKIGSNGVVRKVNFPDSQPFVDSNGKVIVPIRFIAEELGAVVAWNKTTKEVTVFRDNTTLVITINSRDSMINGNKVTMDAAAVIESGRVMGPLRSIVEGLGAKVKWVPGPYGGSILIEMD